MLSCILPENYVDASFEKALNLWLTKANLSEAPSDFIQKYWTSPLSDATFDQLITDLDVENVRRLNAYQDPFGSAWLNVVPSKNLGLKLTDQQLRISLSLRLGAKICEEHTCRCGKLIEENGHHDLSCARSAGRFSRHQNLNTLVKQALSSIKFPSILEPNGLTRTEGAPRRTYPCALGGRQAISLGCYLCRSSCPQQNKKRICCHPRHSR